MSQQSIATTSLTRRVVGFWTWIHSNLLSPPFNVILTLFGLWILYLLVPPMVEWLLTSDWRGSVSADCDSGGLCGVFLRQRLDLILYGFYPSEEVWRPNLAAAIFVAIFVFLFPRFVPVRVKLIIGAVLLTIYPVIAYGLIHGSLLGIEFFGTTIATDGFEVSRVVETDRWGGLMLTLILASFGIVLCFPLGIILALGRRSTTMPIARLLSVVFIEFWRGVPLITVLFMASVMLPLFFPEDTQFEKLSRALIGITLFQAAYMAEVIRGGLQAIPKGQYEAADAVGLNYWKKTVLIILPQALKIVIPGIVNTFITLFKDTSLVSIIGMWDLLNASYGSTRDPEWLPYALEAFVFAALIYWVFCFSMSRYSRSIEHRLAASDIR